VPLFISQAAAAHPSSSRSAPPRRRYEEELLALQNFQQKRVKLEEDLIEAKTFIENERQRHKHALQVPARALQLAVIAGPFACCCCSHCARLSLM
jgi:hypothetical protein